MAASYDLGDLVRVSAVFKNSSGTAIDPTTVKFDWKVGQGGTVTTYTYPTVIVKDSTGNYHVDLDANAEGDFYYRFYSTGAGQAAAEGQFFVESNF